MKYDLELEFSILKTVCSDEPEVRSFLLPRLTPLHFSSSPAQNVFRRIMSVMRKEQYIPTWTDLISDPAVRQESRKAMRTIESRRLRGEEKITSAFRVLDTYRQVRALYQLGADLEEGLEQSAVDVEAILTKLSINLQTVVDGSTETPIVNVGLNDNSIDVVRTLLKTGGPPRIATGFAAYDEKNVGFPMGAFVLLGADTGGGKSTMATVLAENMAMRGASVGLVPLEMNAPENLQRNLARVANEPLSNLIDPLNKITRERRKQILSIYKEYVRRLAALRGKISIIEPKFKATMENVLEFIKPMGLDVFIIDYVGLLDGLSEEDQWRAMSKATAYAKRWAELNKCIVIGLVQISADSVIRYSQAMKEHASYAWFWVNDQLAKDTNVIRIQQAKSRQGEGFDFFLKRDFSKMTIRDLTKEELEEYLEQTRGNSGGNNGGKESSWKNRKKKPKDDDDDDVEAEPRPRKKTSTKDGSKKPSRFEY